MKNQALNSLAKHGKTFRFAGLLLNKTQLEQAARLYHFCRCIDDIADNATDKCKATEQLKAVKRQLTNQCPQDAFVEDFLALSAELNMPQDYASTLIDGVTSDLGRVDIQTESELVQYAFKVAGVVGLMMCPILGADPRGTPYAIDLGIALQLTNIARDVLEDAQMGRRYLPYEWCPMSAQQVTLGNDVETRQQVMQAIERVLALAEHYYTSARQGYTHLPRRSRRAIIVAESVYRAIGVKLTQQGTRYWEGRTTVALTSKIHIAAVNLLRRTQTSSKGHDQTLHLPLRQLTAYQPIEIISDAGA
ncbi:phytoene/squalene synthase family protein [Vibrio sp. WXL210]|uniref:phytoene/squalene synthase family protein n=1 Tax=Vibrio sp. WXL210 TaxID=3450709 RepID=UPI003EC4CE60